MALPATPKLKWGTAFANTWTWSSAPDRPVPRPSVVGAVAEADSGFRSKWTRRDDDEITLISRFVPKLATAGVTGYSDATTGVYHALRWLDKQNQGQFYPDLTSGGLHVIYLLEWEVDRDEGGTHYVVKLKMRDVNGVAFSEY